MDDIGERRHIKLSLQNLINDKIKKESFKAYLNDFVYDQFNIFVFTQTSYFVFDSSFKIAVLYP